MAPFSYIDLFAGVSGLGLGVEIAIPEAQCICHVEVELHAAEVLAARAAEGSLSDCPQWSDIRTFNGRRWYGAVDCIVGGFPCTDLSVAGKRAGIGGKRSGLFHEYMRIVEEAQPVSVFIENVGGLLSSLTLLHRPEILGYFDEVLAAAEASPADARAKERWYAERHVERLHRRLLPIHGISALLYVQCCLGALGYESEAGLFTASEVGASHKRERIFILAYRKGGGLGKLRESPGRQRFVDGSDEAVETPGRAGAVRSVADASRDEREGSHGEDRIRRGVCEAGDGVEPAVRLADAGYIGHASRFTGSESNGRCGTTLADAGDRLVPQPERGPEGRDGAGPAEPILAVGDSLPLFAPGPNDIRWPDILRQFPWLSPAISEEEVESHLRQLDARLADLVDLHRTDSLRAAGNGVTSLCAALALVTLARRAEAIHGLRLTDSGLAFGGRKSPVRQDAAERSSRRN